MYQFILPHLIWNAWFSCIGEVETQQEAQPKEGGQEAKITTPEKIKIKSILLMAGKKLITNPNTHATLMGLIWASIRFR